MSLVESLFPGMNEKNSLHISFLVVPLFTMIGLASIIEPLRIFNRMAGRKAVTWSVVSESGEPVEASNGLRLMVDRSIHEANDAKLTVICTSYQPELYTTKPILSWLVRQKNAGVCLGALDTGVHFLAAAGLLNRYRVTMHWESIPSFKEEYPLVDITYKRFEIDRDIFTCAGGTSGLDLVLHFVRTSCGRDLATLVAEQLIYDNRPNSGEQKLDAVSRLGLHNRKLLSVIEMMESNLDEPLDCGGLSALVGISRRQLERLFSEHLGISPAKYYLKLRLERGRQLLQQSRLNILETALACGFASASDFSRAYKKMFGFAPRNDRKIHHG